MGLRKKGRIAFWAFVIILIGYLTNPPAGHGAERKPVTCVTRSIEFSLSFDGKEYSIRQVKVCTNGEIFLAGRRVICRKSVKVTKRVGGGVVMTSAIVCK